MSGDVDDVVVSSCDVNVTVFVLVARIHGVVEALLRWFIECNEDDYFFDILRFRWLPRID